MGQVVGITDGVIGRAIEDVLRTLDAEIRAVLEPLSAPVDFDRPDSGPVEGGISAIEPSPHPIC